MKKILISVVLCIFLFSACQQNHDKTVYYTPSQFDIITYDALLEFGGEFAMGYYGTLAMDGRETSLDVKRGERDALLLGQMLDELDEILRDQPLHAFKMPVSQAGGKAKDYDAYVIDYFEKEYTGTPMLNVMIATKDNADTPEDALFLDDFTLLMYSGSRCYLSFTYMQKNDIFHQKKYVYYTEDGQLIQKLLDWAETNIDLAENETEE